MAFPQEFIHELKARCNIEDVISQYVQLKRAGSNLTGCCPFHSEKTPSFTVFRNNENFYCFGCGAGGDVITFVMKMENVDYVTAIEHLAARAGLTVPEDGNAMRARVNKERYFEMNKLAARFFYDSLIAPENKDALSYITGRGLTPAIIKRFGIGYADTSWDSLTGYLMSKGFEKEEIKNGFLAGVSQKSGRLFDYFRNRIMFPIFDLSGNVIAFGGRIIGDGKPKYLNSSDTPVFKKSRNLYALNHAKNNTDSSLILCEGYMDVVALQQAGFVNAVATLGTALTSEQTRIISRYANTVYLCYDSDEAGQRASKRAIDMLGDVGVKVKVVTVEGAKDPDEYIKKYGKASFEKLLKGSDGHIEYAIKNISSKYNLDIPEQKLAYLDECCQMLSGVYSDIEKEIFVQRISAESGIAAEIIRNEIKKRQIKTHRRAVKDAVRDDINKSIGYGDRINADSAKNLSTVKKEENLLGILMIRPEFINSPSLKELLSEEIFQCEFSKKVWREICRNADALQDGIETFGDAFTADEMGRIVQMTVRRNELKNNSEAVAAELARSLRKEADRKKSDDGSDDSFFKRIEELKKTKK
ncbi:MAG: DNA primase [Ruminococcaceae bacterium]|nr:DNA primase [Oscillospiraceae bacterium]